MKKKILGLVMMLGLAMGAFVVPVGAITKSTAQSKCNGWGGDFDEASRVCTWDNGNHKNACEAAGGDGSVAGSCTWSSFDDDGGTSDNTGGGSSPNDATRAEHSKCVSTSIIGEGGQYCDENGDGSGVYKLLNIVVNVLTMGVGVLGVLGITIAGIQYATSGGNEQQMAKAKKRILEVVLGLVVFGVMWAVLQFIIPGGVFGNA